MKMASFHQQYQQQKQTSFSCNATVRYGTSLVDYQMWKKFIEGKAPAVQLLDPILRRSWCRCQDLGIDPVAQPPAVKNYCQPSDELIAELLQPIEQKLLPQLFKQNLMLSIANAQGYLMQSNGSSQALHKAELLRFEIGAHWAEDSVGTNAIGTALATGLPVQIFHREHYCESHHLWRCSAAPFFSPLGGATIGCFDISSYAQTDHFEALGLVLWATRQFEHMLFTMRAKSLDALPPELLEDHGLQRTDGVILAYADGKIAGVSQRAKALLGRRLPLTQQKQLQALFEIPPLPQGPSGSLVDLRLASGNPLVLPAQAKMLWSPGGYSPGILVRIPDPDSSAVKQFRGTKMPRGFRGGREGAVQETLGIIGVSEAAAQVRLQAAGYARTFSTVLVTGESGTGKELIARAIHNTAMWRDKPFIAINCGALVPELIQSELFGYSPGAFTGADKNGRAGAFELADGGILFLDEICELSLLQQTNLLRVLEESMVTRVGSNSPIPFKIKIIAATNKDITEEVQRGTFRADLYYRLYVGRIHLPPLRERKEDILSLVHHHLARLAAELHVPLPAIGTEVQKLFETYPWPGNIRELVNTLEFALNQYYVKPYSVLGAEALPPQFHGRPTACSHEAFVSLQQAEEQYIKKVLRYFHGNKSYAAKALGIGRNTLYAKMERFKN